MRKLTTSQGIAAIACLAFRLAPVLADEGAASPSSSQTSVPSESLAAPTITGHEHDLAPGNVIVAVNGYRVNNFTQWAQDHR